MSVAVATPVQPGSPLGSPVPPFTPHAISVSLPTWRDNVGYEEGEKRVADAMVNGYPRFFIHLSIQKLARICEQKFGTNGESCLLWPTKTVADQCRSFMLDHSSRSGSPITVRLIQFLICPEDKQSKDVDPECERDSASTSSCAELHIVLFPENAFPIAKQFWQHTGMGISSRLADHCLAMLPEESSRPHITPPPMNRLPSKGHNRHYSVKGAPKSFADSSGMLPQVKPSRNTSEILNKDHGVYLEERYGRNLPLGSAAAAKRALRRRIAGVLVHDNPDDCSGGPCAGEQDVEVGPSSRGVENVTEDDVFLFPTGMCAIWQAHNLLLSVRRSAKSVCFGFSYCDTLKILEKWGPGCHFLGHGLDSDLDTLEGILKAEISSSRDHTSPPILALFTEFPSNPLLRSPNLPRLRALADKYDFLIVVDETIGNFVNVEVLPYADIVVSSLTKVFSGDSNVMGGSLVLNPTGRHYKALKSHLSFNFEDLYFDEDAIYMERNSRNFRSRVKTIDGNTEAVCDFLRSRSVAGGVLSSAIKEVYYPKWIARDNFERCRVKPSSSASDLLAQQGGGFGGLFSLTFTSTTASRAFFDALSCHKGPSLGTNFTLACPYTILAHYMELEWAAQYGVEEGIVRISVGMEERRALLQSIEKACKAAEDAA